MSHIHLPDGILPVWLWVLGYIFVGFYLFFLSIYLKRNNPSKKFILVGVCAALMTVAMSIEIVPIAYHINISVLSGIILGPVLSPLAALVSNIFLALMGHGGITVIGLNTIVISTEAVLGYFLFKAFKEIFKKVFLSGFLATFLALFIASWLSIGIVYLGTGNLSETMHAPGQGFVRFEPAEKHEAHKQEPQFDFKRFLTLILIFGSIGWTIESLITAFMIRYIRQIKPELLEDNIS